MEILIATNNLNKVKEYQEILSPLGFKCLSLNDLNINCDPNEVGTTFSENAYIKASEIAKFTNKVVIADDSGLVVDAYPDLLGIYSHRFLENEPYSVKNAELIKMVDGKVRTGRYICVICVMNLLDKPIFFEGRFEGTIAYEPKGNNGFGYDPIFIPEGYDKTVAELSNEEKNQMSHRGIASRKLVDFLNSMK